MVIREDDFVNNLHLAFPQKRGEGVRVGDPGKGENFLPLQETNRFFPMRADETHRLVVAVKHLCPRMDVADLFFQRSRGLRIVYFGEKKKIGSAKMRQGFPQNSSWQKRLVSETNVRVDEQDIEVPVEGEMLVAIVQQQPFRAKLLKSDSTIGKPIFPDEDRDPLANLSHQKGFIP